MNYHWFNKQEWLSKYRNNGGKEKAAKYYLANKCVLK